MAAGRNPTGYRFGGDENEVVVAARGLGEGALDHEVAFQRAVPLFRPQQLALHATDCVVASGDVQVTTCVVCGLGWRGEGGQAGTHGRWLS